MENAVMDGLKHNTGLKERTFFYSLGAIAATLFAIGLMGAGWLLLQAPWSLWQGGPTALPQAAVFVPRQAPLMASLLVNPDRLTDLRQLWTPPAQRRQAAAEMAQLQQQLWARLSLDYATDVQPWLGEEITLAVTTPDLDRDASNGQQPGYLVALATQDAGRSQALLTELWQRQATQGQDLVFERYAGVEIIHNQTTPTVTPTAQSPATLATAAIGTQFLLFANDPKVLREAVNNVQAPNLSLTQSPAYQAALAALPRRHVGLVYTKLPELTTWLNQSILATVAIAEPNPAPAQFDRLIAALTLQPQGMQVETAFLPAPGSPLMPTPPRLHQPTSALAYMPGDRTVVLAGTDLASTWTGLLDGLAGYGTIATLVAQPLQWLQTQWQIDLATELFPAIRQDYALGLSNQGHPHQLEWVLAAQHLAAIGTDTAAAVSLADLDQRAQQEGFTIGQLTLADHPVTIWTKLSTVSQPATAAPALQATIVGAHTTVGDYTLIASDLPSLEAALQPTTASTLAAAFTRLPLEPTNNGYAYINWPELRPWLERRSPLFKLAATSLEPLLQHLQGLTLTSYERTPQWQRSGLFVAWR